MLMNRMRQDFQLALVVMFGIGLNLMIVPFTIYRFLDGQLLAGSIDALVVLGVNVGVWRACHHGSTAGVALFLASIASVGCVAVANVQGLAGPLWLYGVVVTNFLLVERKRAAAISAICIVAVAASPLALPELAIKAAFVGSALGVCAFAYVSVWRTEMQRNRLEDLALLDPLTGAGNRRGMNTEVEIAIATSSRAGKLLGLIIFDLDHFKRVNDQHGHDAGDDVLVQVANVVRSIVRKNDRFFRLGGEEFALLVCDSSRGELHDIAEKLRLAIQHQVHCGGSAVTASFGASILRPGESTRSWQTRADAAMYRAKHEGRNRTVVDETMVADKPVVMRPAGTPGAGGGSGSRSQSVMRKDIDVRNALESPRTLGSRRLNNGAIEGRPAPSRLTNSSGWK